MYFFFDIACFFGATRLTLLRDTSENPELDRRRSKFVVLYAHFEDGCLEKEEEGVRVLLLECEVRVVWETSLASLSIALTLLLFLSLNSGFSLFSCSSLSSCSPPSSFASLSLRSLSSSRSSLSSCSFPFLCSLLSLCSSLSLLFSRSLSSFFLSLFLLSSLSSFFLFSLAFQLLFFLLSPGFPVLLAVIRTLAVRMNRGTR